MPTKKKNKKIVIGPITSIMIITGIIAVMSTIFSLLGIDGTKTVITNNTLETSLITVNNVLTVDGLKSLFSSIVSNFKLYEPLVLFVIALIGVSICEESGLLKAIFDKFKKIKPTAITFMVLLIGFIASCIGDYSYVIFLPLVGIMYKYLHRNSILGIITMFIGLTLGHAAGFFYNFDTYTLGGLTQNSANISVDQNYIFSLSSNLYLAIFSSLIFIICVTGIVTSYLEPKFAKPERVDHEIVFSKKAYQLTTLAFVIMLLFVAFLIIPGIGPSGILLDLNQKEYIAKLFSESSPFREGILFIFIFMMMICGLIYGKISKNIKNSSEYNNGLSKSFSKTGYVFALMFYSSIMISILSYTNIGEVIAVNIIEMLGALKFSGILLIVALFLGTILMTLFIPSSITKWQLASPVIVPLFMKANISPSFTQYAFLVGDSIGKCITPIFAYFIVMIGLMEKYNDGNYRISIFETIKLTGKTILLITIIGLLIVIGWYIIGLPTGNGVYPTL